MLQNFPLHLYATVRIPLENEEEAIVEIFDGYPSSGIGNRDLLGHTSFIDVDHAQVGDAEAVVVLDHVVLEGQKEVLVRGLRHGLADEAHLFRAEGHLEYR